MLFLDSLNTNIWSDPVFKSLKKLTQKLYVQENFSRKLTNRNASYLWKN